MITIEDRTLKEMLTVLLARYADNLVRFVICGLAIIAGLVFGVSLIADFLQHMSVK